MVEDNALQSDNFSVSPHGNEMDRKDREILRSLAFRVTQLASRPVEQDKKELWYKHNQLEPTRPLIFCDPENGWNEIITQDMLQCSGELSRQWEKTLRKEIFWGEQMGDDRIIEPFFNIHYAYNESDWGMKETKVGGIDGDSYRWEAPLKDYKDLGRLHFPKISVDYEQTGKLFALASEVFGDYLTVRLRGSWWWSLGLTWTLINLRGLEQAMLDMYDYPDELHKLMGILRDGNLVRLDFLESVGLLSLNNKGDYVGSGGFGWTDELPQRDFDGKNVRTMDLWGFAESQETVGVSSEMFGEFVLPYQLPLLERFGLNCYGCCEPLNSRWHLVEKIPRLRRVSVSPWSNLADMAEKLSGNYIYSMKPSPAYLAVENMDEGHIRKSLRDALHITGNCRVEVIMKDNHTIGRNPQNVIRWCRIAREEAERL